MLTDKSLSVRRAITALVISTFISAVSAAAQMLLWQFGFLLTKRVVYIVYILSVSFTTTLILGLCALVVSFIAFVVSTLLDESRKRQDLWQ